MSDGGGRRTGRTAFARGDDGHQDDSTEARALEPTTDRTATCR